VPSVERHAARAVAALDGNRSSPAPPQDHLPPGKIDLQQTTVIKQWPLGKT
jgi:hypothetical protein